MGLYRWVIQNIVAALYILIYKSRWWEWFRLKSQITQFCIWRAGQYVEISVCKIEITVFTKTTKGYSFNGN